MKRTFDYELIHTTAVILSTGSGDKYEEVSGDLSDDEIYEIGARLADHQFGGLRNDEEAYIQTGWLIIDRNNDGDCFLLADETGHCVIDTSADRAQELFIAYIRESIENYVAVSEANRALVEGAEKCQ